MKKLVFLFVIIIFFSFNQVIYAQITDIQGWNGTKWGMSKDEIIQIFKNEIVQLPKPEKYSKFYADIGLNDYKIGNILYEVRFLMDYNTNNLQQINIKKSSNNYVNEPTITDFNVLEEMLVDKYGKWSYKNQDRTSIRTVWTFPSTSITLSFIQFAPNIPIIFSLIYSSRSISKTDRL